MLAISTTNTISKSRIISGHLLVVLNRMSLYEETFITTEVIYDPKLMWIGGFNS